ncbi:amidase [Rhodococcus sp. UFZ-B548]|uniref:amidase n=1 Tax=Rhodococcus sp. UFZ-B548 TaxID=2742212 RepID=UPI0015F39DE7|nr:amidase [Rhodococcus sp. UFZ-B548]
MISPVVEARQKWVNARGLAHAMRSDAIDRSAWYDDLSRHNEAAAPELGAFTQTVANAPASSVDGALAGIPIVVKDNIDVAGVVTGLGRPLSEGTPARVDAASVALLRAAGAVIIAKTNLPEFASSPITYNPTNGPARNPHDLDRTAGGSSGGSAAAIAADLAVVGIGTDTGGSVVVPAALTGVYGLRPTYGSISTDGVFPLSWSMDTVGIFAKDPNDVRLVRDVLVQAHDHAAAAGRSGGGSVRIGIPRSWLVNVSGYVSDAFDAAIQRLREQGHEIVDVATSPADEIMANARVIHFSEAAAAFDELPEAATPYAEAVEYRRVTGFGISGPDYARARQNQRRWRAELTWILDDVDFIACPTSPIVAPRIGEFSDRDALELVRFAYPFCFAGVPALSVPCPVSGMPVGMTLVTGWGDDRLLDFAERL